MSKPLFSRDQRLDIDHFIRAYPFVLFLLILVFLCAVRSAFAEESFTKFFVPEKFLIDTFKEQAGLPDPANINAVKDVDLIQYKTSSGSILKGYRLTGRNGNGGAADSFVLVLPGDAQLCDKLISKMDTIRKSGVDVYMYDYRGFGRSTGESSIGGVIRDTRELLNYLEGFNYKHRYIYGISFGGFVILNATRSSDQLKKYDGIVIDSTPDSIPFIKSQYQPIHVLPGNCKNFLLISGGNDRQVRTSDMAEMLKVAEKRGAMVKIQPTLGHPFDPKESVHESETRIDLVLRFFYRDKK